MNRPPLRARELTARGRGAISVLALEGPGALDRVRALARGPVPGSAPIAIVRLGSAAPGAATQELLDEALLVVDSPESLELHLHGSPSIVRRLIAELGAEPWPDRPGSLEERAETALADSSSEAAARVLLDQQQGALRRELERLQGLTGGPFLAALATLVHRGRVARALVRPPCLVLAGPVNAGKSTLFNVLVGRERVVVDSAPGTTRDAVRERVRLGAYAVDLCDSAGAREIHPADPEGAIERAGQQLSARLQAEADLVLVLVPPGADHRMPSIARGAGGGKERVLFSRADERHMSGGELGWPSLSALGDPAQARAVVEGVFHRALGLPRDPWTPGVGVPFFEELQRDLEAALEGTPSSRAGLGTWLSSTESRELGGRELVDRATPIE